MSLRRMRLLGAAATRACRPAPQPAARHPRVRASTRAGSPNLAGGCRWAAVAQEASGRNPRDRPDRGRQAHLSVARLLRKVGIGQVLHAMTGRGQAGPHQGRQEQEAQLHGGDGN